MVYAPHWDLPDVILGILNPNIQVVTGPISVHPGSHSVGLSSQPDTTGEDDEIVGLGRRQVVAQLGGIATRLGLVPGLS